MSERRGRDTRWPSSPGRDLGCFGVVSTEARIWEGSAAHTVGCHGENCLLEESGDIYLVEASGVPAFIINHSKTASCFSRHFLVDLT